MSKAVMALGREFLNSFCNLPKKIQLKTTEFLAKFNSDPLSRGINFEKLQNAKDDKIYSVRIDQTYRGIVVRDHDTYLLLWVDHHDEAYEWARRKRCEVNKRTGTIQLYEVQDNQEIDENKSIEGLFSEISDENLINLGVPEIIIPFIKQIPDKETFVKYAEKLPHDVYENLSWLTEGIPLSEVLELAKSNQASSDNKIETFSDALQQPSTQRDFVVINGEDELEKIIKAPLEQWRVFLHPSQRSIVEKNFNGPARVTGGAGTGKTVVAMHRCKRLASELNSDNSILFTTFSKNLAQDINNNLKKICSPEEMADIEIINLDAWVTRFFENNNIGIKVGYNKEIDSLWEMALVDSNDNSEYSLTFYKNEWKRVIEANSVYDLDKYITVSRTGRGTRLDQKSRINIWPVFQKYIEIMEQKHVYDIDYAMDKCAKLLVEAVSFHPYQHIIVDEGQDLSPSAYRLLRVMSGDEHKNDLFIVGDSHQRIYENHASLSKCGINIRGRSSKLYINYRTTDEIRRYALKFLNGLSFDDLDDEIDSDDKCQSLTHGSNPKIIESKDLNHEFQFLEDEIRKLQANGVNLKDICIVARTNKLVKEYENEMNSRGFRVYEIKSTKADDRSQEGLRMSTMHRIKGLEFEYIFIVSANKGILPLSAAIDHTDAVSEQESMTSEKCLLYVAITRAQRGAYICYYGKKSVFLI